MAKAKAKAKVEGLEDYFERGPDGRFYCMNCLYDTQLVNKARNHARKKHGAKLALPGDPHPRDYALGEFIPQDEIVIEVKETE